MGRSQASIISFDFVLNNGEWPRIAVSCNDVGYPANEPPCCIGRGCLLIAVDGWRC